MLTWLSILMFLPVLGFMVCWCCGCEILNYQFTTSETVSDNWDEISGTWSISGDGSLTCGGTSGVIIANTEHPSASPSGRLQVTLTTAISGMVSGDEIRILFAYEDSNNHLYQKLTYNGTSFISSVWNRVAGVDSRVTKDAASSSSVASLAGFGLLCYDGTYVSTLAGASFGDTGVARTGTAGNTGKKIGLQVVQYTAGDFKFSSVVWRHANITRSSCTCRDLIVTQCGKCSGTSTSMMQIEISGMANGSCGTCGDLNATWMLESSSSGSPDSECIYGYSFLSSLCGVSPGMDANFQNVVFSSNYELRLRIQKTGFGLMQWAKVFGATMPNCSITGESMTGYSNVSFAECNGSTATITATAYQM